MLRRVISGSAIVAMLLTAIFLAFKFTGTQSDEPRASDPKKRIEPEVGALAPDFTLPNLADKKMTLSEQRGKVVFLNFWATWCPACRVEMPSMEKLYQRFKGKDFEMLAVSTDRRVSTIKDFVKELGLTFPILHDSDKKVAGIYRISSIPRTFIIDKKGVIVSKVYGARDWADKDVIAQIEKLIEGD